jgi:hypothetical protein
MANVNRQNALMNSKAFVHAGGMVALGPKLEVKLHIAVGDADTYSLNNAVHMLEKQLRAHA